MYGRSSMWLLAFGELIWIPHIGHYSVGHSKLLAPESWAYYHATLGKTPTPLPPRLKSLSPFHLNNKLEKLRDYDHEITLPFPKSQCKLHSHKALGPLSPVKSEIPLSTARVERTTQPLQEASQAPNVVEVERSRLNAQISALNVAGDVPYPPDQSNHVSFTSKKALAMPAEAYSGWNETRLEEGNVCDALPRIYIISRWAAQNVREPSQAQ
ncbi:hypothetical protein BDQ17DRAFT_1332719 [Cyathus striatus]|nr:hypothetical protein BDQ17DRAFT_1332719 [Cyathus striatus]